MTTYRLMDGASGRPGVGSSGTQPPASGTAYSGNYLAGLVFKVTSGSLWLSGYHWYVAASGQDTNPAGGTKFALWQIWGNSQQTFVPGSTVTSGTLTAGAWNFVALATPLLLAQGAVYEAAIGYVAASGFPLTANQFGASQPYSAGITNGPLHAYGSSTGSDPTPFTRVQMPFSTAGNDPAVIMPGLNDLNDILWLDVQVTDVAPASPRYRIFPNMPGATLTGGSQSLAYTLGMQFSLSQSCTLQKIWHYSSPGSTVLPTRCAIWAVSGQTVVSGTDNTSPSWKKPDGTAASAGVGWIYVDYSASGVTLAPSTNYKVSTFTNDNVDPWFGATTGYWTSGGNGSAGLAQGPLTAPNSAGASPGQNSWNTGITWTYPNTSTSPENDWIDVEVAPVVSAPSPPIGEWGGGTVSGPQPGGGVSQALPGGSATSGTPGGSIQ